jgi:hypothetical protein
MTETQQADDFNPNDFMDAPITQDEAEGRKPLIPEGLYRNARIESVVPEKPFESDAAKGVMVVYKVAFVTEDYPAPIVLNIKKKGDFNGKGTYYKVLLKAMFDEAQVGKTPRDWVNEQVDLMCSIKEFNGKDCNNWNFLKCKG